MPGCLDETVRAQKQGLAVGLVSICSAHPWVLKAAMQSAAQSGAPVLVEATCNQVNQFGGYTGLTPPGFAAFVRALAAENGLAGGQLLLGGDHLGPNPWQDEPAGRALEKSAGLVRAYVQAGFEKIHLDASMRLADDPPGALPAETIARRAALLASAAEAGCPEGAAAPRYVIGTEVPVPGGAQDCRHGVAVTTAAGVEETVDLHRAAFWQAGLQAAWERVVAVVVQPGVEFCDDFVLDYRPGAARDLVRFIEGQPRLVYEAHSTDYQRPASLRSLVRDHFAILKVGPALTYAFRQAAFALAMMEDELLPAERRSNLIAVLDGAMRRAPAYWQKYYPGTPVEQAFKRKYSLSDRIRYYWSDPQVQAALQQLLANLGSAPLPLALLHQYAPQEYDRVRSAEIRGTPQDILLGRISIVLGEYAAACAP